MPLVGEEVFQGGEEEGAEAAAGAVGVADVVLFEELAEEGLGEVLGVVVVVALAAGEGVEGKPVGLAEVGEGGVGSGADEIAGGEDEGPLGLNKIKKITQFLAI